MVVIGELPPSDNLLVAELRAEFLQQTPELGQQAVEGVLRREATPTRFAEFNPALTQIIDSALYN